MPLHIGKSDTALLLLASQNQLSVGANSGMYFAIGNRYTGAIKTIGTSGAESRLGFFTYAISTQNNLREYLSILDDGKVGVGTTTPTSLLDVNGAVRFRGNGAGSGHVLTSDASGTGSWQSPASLNTAFAVGTTLTKSIGVTFTEIIPFNQTTGLGRFDDGGNFNVITKGYTAPATGVYSFTVSAGIAAGTAAWDGVLRISASVNGFSRNLPFAEVQTFAGKPLPRLVDLSFIVKLTAGEEVTAQLFNGSGIVVTTEVGNRCIFSGYRLY